MKKILNFIMVTLVATLSSSCLDSNLEDLGLLSDCDIIGIETHYRYIDENQKIPASGEPKVIQIRTAAFSRTYVTDEDDPTKGVCTIKYTKQRIPASELANFSESNLVVTVDLSTAATIRPLGDSPELGVPGDWTKDWDYEVTAADGTKKTWTIVVEDGD
jgi:hypothetical protein